MLMVRPFLAKPVFCVDPQSPVARRARKARSPMVSQAAAARSVHARPWPGLIREELEPIPIHWILSHPGRALQLPATLLTALTAGCSDLSPNRKPCLPGC